MDNPGFKIRSTLLLNEDSVSVKRAAEIINRGGLVAFPTETVYGLGASVTNVRALKKVFAAKGRPADNPLIVHLSNPDQLKIVVHSVPVYAKILIDRFWPGPLSLVLPKSETIPDLVSAGLPTVAVRMPDHPVALNLIEAAGVPIAAPSANRSGMPSPTTFRHVLKDLSGRIDAVIKSSICVIGVESTVLDLTGEQPVILRPGGLSRELLEEALGRAIPIAGKIEGGCLPASPGMKYRHYSPNAPLILVVGSTARRRYFIETLAVFYQRQGLLVGMLNLSSQQPLSKQLDSEQLAAKLYYLLRQLDSAGVDVILAEEVSVKGIGLAVMNRLRKASARIIKV